MKLLTDKQLLLLKMLRRNYPLAFPEEPVPLKSGILEDMKAEIQDFGGNCIKKLIIFYCRQENYLQVIADAEPGTVKASMSSDSGRNVIIVSHAQRSERIQFLAAAGADSVAQKSRFAGISVQELG